MSAKQTALQIISKLADDVTWRELTDELYAAAVREGLDELDRGEGIPHDEVKRQCGTAGPILLPIHLR